MSRRAGAEAIGTFWLVFGGCGAAVLAATFLDVESVWSAPRSPSVFLF